MLLGRPTAARIHDTHPRHQPRAVATVLGDLESISHSDIAPRARTEERKPTKRRRHGVRECIDSERFPRDRNERTYAGDKVQVGDKHGLNGAASNTHRSEG